MRYSWKYIMSCVDRGCYCESRNVLWMVIRVTLNEVVEFPGGGESGKRRKSVKKLKRI